MLHLYCQDKHLIDIVKLAIPKTILQHGLVNNKWYLLV